MTQVRRRILRPAHTVTVDDTRRLQRASRQRTQLDTHRKTLSRWMSKLKRAFHAIERLQGQIARLERQLKG